MLTVSPLRDDAKAEFERLFSDYYTELECDERSEERRVGKEC